MFLNREGAEKRVTVPVGSEHDEFIAHYNAARKGQLVNLEPEKKPEIETHANSLDTAITGYLKYLERGVTTARFHQRRYLRGKVR